MKSTVSPLWSSLVLLPQTSQFYNTEFFPPSTVNCWFVSAHSECLTLLLESLWETPASCLDLLTVQSPCFGHSWSAALSVSEHHARSCRAPRSDHDSTLRRLLFAQNNNLISDTFIYSWCHVSLHHWETVALFCWSQSTAALRAATEQPVRRWPSECSIWPQLQRKDWTFCIHIFSI